MAQWGTNDASSNAVLWAPTSVKLAPNTTNRDSLYGNTTANAFVDGVTVGMFAVDSGEIAADSGKITHTGWILRTEGQGGRAGRVQTEVLIAGGITGDGSDDTTLPDYRIVINTQPSNATANTTAEEEATFTVGAVTVPAGGSLTYAWTYANGGTIQAGANVGVTTGATLTVNSGIETANVSFKVEISTTGGAANVTSANAVLTITT